MWSTATSSNEAEEQLPSEEQQLQAAIRASLGLPPPSPDELSPAALAAAVAAAAAEAAPPPVDAGTRARQRAELLAHATGLPRWSGAPQAPAAPLTSHPSLLAPRFSPLTP